MQALLALATSIAGRGGFLLGRTARRVALVGAAIWLGGVMIVGATVMGAAAVWLHVANSDGPVQASICVAVAYACLALVFCLVAVAASRQDARRRRAEAQQSSMVMHQALPLLLASTNGLFSRHKGSLLLAAVVAGLVAANRAGKR